jgi:hypothetical protein
MRANNFVEGSYQCTSFVAQANSIGFKRDARAVRREGGDEDCGTGQV